MHDIVIIVIVIVIDIGFFAMRVSIEYEYNKYNYSSSSSQEISTSDFAETVIHTYQLYDNRCLIKNNNKKMVLVDKNLKVISN